MAESARIDGASEMRIFAGIFLPISLPALRRYSSWNTSAAGDSITIPASILTNEAMYTLPLKLKTMILSTNSTSGTRRFG